MNTPGVMIVNVVSGANATARPPGGKLTKGGQGSMSTLHAPHLASTAEVPAFAMNASLTQREPPAPRTSPLMLIGIRMRSKSSSARGAAARERQKAEVRRQK